MGKGRNDKRRQTRFMAGKIGRFHQIIECVYKGLNEWKEQKKVKKKKIYKKNEKKRKKKKNEMMMKINL